MMALETFYRLPSPLLYYNANLSFRTTAVESSVHDGLRWLAFEPRMHAGAAARVELVGTPDEHFRSS